jgi:SAM-dependent methyltransferase
MPHVDDQFRAAPARATAGQPACPTCEAPNPIRLGRLPDSNWFAGTELEHPLPGGDLYRCTRCHLKFRFPVLSSVEYVRLYDNAITENWGREVERPDWERVVDVVERRVPLGGRVLDFGCYTGGLLARLAGRFDCHGVEVNRAAAASARATTGAAIMESVAKLSPALRFEAVIAVDVIEHVRDPRKLVEQLMSLVTDDGVLIISTGDAEHRTWQKFGANWWYCSYPEHIAFISRAWLDSLCEVTPVVVLEYKKFAYRRLAGFSRVFEFVGMIFYGWLPRTFLTLKRFKQQLRSQRGLLRVPGNGVGADHLLIVLARNRPNE